MKFLLFLRTVAEKCLIYSVYLMAHSLISYLSPVNITFLVYVLFYYLIHLKSAFSCIARLTKGMRHQCVNYTYMVQGHHT